MIRNVIPMKQGESKTVSQIDRVVQMVIESKETGEQGECLVFVATVEQALNIATPDKDEKVIL